MTKISEPSAFEMAFGPDPRAPHIQAALTALAPRPPNLPDWRAAIDQIADVVAAARREASAANRAATRERLLQLATLAEGIKKITARREIREALKFLAQRGSRDIDPITGFEFLTQLAARSKRAAGKIRVGPGGDTLGVVMGFPSAELVCAASTLEAWMVARGTVAGETNSGAIATCNAIWLASGGAPLGGAGSERGRGESDSAGAWVGHFKKAKLIGVPKDTAAWDEATVKKVALVRAAGHGARRIVAALRNEAP